MKHLLFIPIFILLAFLSACGGDEPDNPNNTENENQKVTRTIIGVWTGGQFFVSFCEDKHYAAYIDLEYLESGTFELSNDSTKIICKNAINGKTTTYEVSFRKHLISTSPMVQGYTMIAKVNFINIYGESVTKTLDFLETDITPISKNDLNPILNKIGVYSNDITNRRFDFHEKYSGTLSSTDNGLSAYPLPFNYLYFRDRIYVQIAEIPENYPIIKNWSDNHWVSAYTIGNQMSDNFISLKGASTEF